MEHPKGVTFNYVSNYDITYLPKPESENTGRIRCVETVESTGAVYSSRCSYSGVVNFGTDRYEFESFEFKPEYGSEQSFEYLSGNIQKNGQNATSDAEAIISLIEREFITKESVFFGTAQHHFDLGGLYSGTWDIRGICPEHQPANERTDHFVLIIDMEKFIDDEGNEHSATMKAMVDASILANGTSDEYFNKKLNIEYVSVDGTYFTPDSITRVEELATKIINIAC